MFIDTNKSCVKSGKTHKLAHSLRTISLTPDAYPAALLLTADHQQPRHYTPYAEVTQV